MFAAFMYTEMAVLYSLLDFILANLVHKFEARFFQKHILLAPFQLSSRRIWFFPSDWFVTTPCLCFEVL
jgi:hypothetical protein